MDPNKQGQQVTGDEFDNILRSVVADEIAKLNKPAGEPEPPAAQPIKLNIGGTDYEFKTQAELNQALNQTFAGYSQQLAALQAQQEEAARGSHVTDDETPSFDMKQYIAMMEKNPIDAAEYLDSHRYFGGKVDKPSTVIREQLIKSAELERVVAAYQFKDAHPEYQPSPQSAQVIEQVRQALNLPPTFDGLEAAYATAITKGFLPDPRMEQLRQQMQQYQPSPGGMQPPPQTRTYAPPPVPSNGGMTPNTQVSLDAAEDLSLDQLARILTQAPNLGR